MPEGLTAAKKKIVRSANCIALPSGVPRSTGLSADEALRARRMTPAMWLRPWSDSNSSIMTGRLSALIIWRIPASLLCPSADRPSGRSRLLAVAWIVDLPQLGGP